MFVTDTVKQPLFATSLDTTKPFQTLSKHISNSKKIKITYWFNWLEILLFHTLTASSSLSLQRHIAMNRIMSSQRSDLIEQKLSQHTSFFGIKLWILITASASIAFLLAFIVFVSLCFIFHRRRCRQEPFRLRSKLCLPLSRIPLNNDRRHNPYNRCPEYIESGRISSQVGWSYAHLPYYTRSFSSTTSSFGSFTVFTFMEIESVTDGFADENLIAKGDSSMVYRGVLMGTVNVAVKRFFPIYQRFFLPFNSSLWSRWLFALPKLDTTWWNIRINLNVYNPINLK